MAGIILTGFFDAKPYWRTLTYVGITIGWFMAGAIVFEVRRARHIKRIQGANPHDTHRDDRPNLGDAWTPQEQRWFWFTITWAAAGISTFAFIMVSNNPSIPIIAAIIFLTPLPYLLLRRYIGAWREDEMEELLDAIEAKHGRN